jgi:hypothetical protein
MNTGILLEIQDELMKRKVDFGNGLKPYKTLMIFK